jgi:hypothetical protein
VRIQSDEPVSVLGQGVRHVLGVPLQPIRVGLAELLLMQAVRGGGTLERIGQPVGHIRFHH